MYTNKELMIFLVDGEVCDVMRWMCYWNFHTWSRHESGSPVKGFKYHILDILGDIHEQAHGPWSSKSLKRPMP